MNFLTGINSAASALHAENTRLEIVSQNIANAQTTRTPDGGPYRRQTVSFETIMNNAAHAGAANNGVRVAAISADRTPGPRVHNPGHPDADANGMVAMPNVDLAFEMVDMISASRAYEANLAVVRQARQMAAKALSIGR
jgi:flagellar basal-body rod protein FlgC